MSAFDYLNRLERIFFRIKNGSSGNPDMLSDLIGISKRQLFNDITELKDMGVPIAYSRQQQRYYLKQSCDLKFDFSVIFLEAEELTILTGGYVQKLVQCFHIALKQDIFEMQFN